MRTWGEIIDCLRNDTLKPELSIEKNYTSKYKEFVNEVIHYMTLFLKGINCTVTKTDYDHSTIDIAFEKSNKLFALRMYRWSLRIRIFAINDISDFDVCRYWYKQKIITIPPINPTNPFANPLANCKLPKHAKYKVGDLVYLSNSTPIYKKRTDSNKVFEIVEMYTYPASIMYSVKSVSFESAYYTRFAEGNLKKIIGGV